MYYPEPKAAAEHFKGDVSFWRGVRVDRRNRTELRRHHPPHFGRQLRLLDHRTALMKTSPVGLVVRKGLGSQATVNLSGYLAPVK